jgi:Fe(II)/alpha-ketoglutarate-dependent arginine beta-hydroxylase
MKRIALTDGEVDAVQRLLAGLCSRYESVDDPAFLNEAPVAAHELPRRVRCFLNDFKRLEPAGGCLISGYPVEAHRIGPTPSHWKSREGVSPTLAEEMLFILFGSLLGDVFGWATQQDGYVIHDVLPIKADEVEQISTGSRQPIWWHNEDAFHPYRGDYVALMCLRNPERVPTTYASVEAIGLDREAVKTLFEPHYVILPDLSHAAQNGAGAEAHSEGDAALREAAYRQVKQLHDAPQKQPVFYGDPKSPYLCLDPYFMNPPDDDRALAALNKLMAAIDERLTEVVLSPGDFLFIDNYRAVHGRKPFEARYDGTDRWLKRLNITRDLRKSRAARRDCSSHIIF